MPLRPARPRPGLGSGRFLSGGGFCGFRGSGGGLGLALGALLAGGRFLRLFPDHRRGGETGVCKHLLDTLGRLCALSKPVGDALGFQRQALVMVIRHHRVVGADTLHIPTVTRAEASATTIR